MRLRPTRPADFEKARDFLPPSARFAPGLREQLPGLWRELHARGQLNSLTIEHPRPTGEHEVVAVGISVFVSEPFADHALEHPEPFLNARLHELIVAGRSPVLDQRQVADAHLGAGLTLLPVPILIQSCDFADPLVVRLLGAANDAFRVAHGGYHIRRIVMEVTGDEQYRFMLAGGMLSHAEFGDGQGAAMLAGVADADRPRLMMVDRPHMRLGSPISFLLTREPARFGFSAAERRLLQCALLLDTDAEIADETGLSRDTIRTQWRSIFDRVARTAPSLLPSSDLDAEEVRGPNKRRKLLQYINSHLEELRPSSPRRRGSPSLGDAAGTRLG